jgi:hypothetical protein
MSSRLHGNVSGSGQDKALNAGRGTRGWHTLKLPRHGAHEVVLTHVQVLEVADLRGNHAEQPVAIEPELGQTGTISNPRWDETGQLVVQ